ncbi:hypothetical protein MLD52_13695 [Puniceicoccaceae bacterium K14]|nr:hypothetical protein [Puniceicoccaceae bacterium K14]
MRASSEIITDFVMQKPSNSLTLKKALSYSNGYRELGMHDWAFKEIEALPDDLKVAVPALQMQLAISMDAKKWNKALPFAKKLHDVDPEASENHVNLAFVMRRARSMQSARKVLETAAKKFPGVAIIHYNLACYACLNKNTEEAKSFLNLAFELDEAYLKISLEDEDLEQLRPWIKKAIAIRETGSLDDQ